MAMASASLRSSVASASRRTRVSPHGALSFRSYAKAAPVHKVVSPSPDEYTIPEIHLGPDHPNRYRRHYEETLKDDLLYMTYNHRLSNRKPRAEAPKKPQTPYEVNRAPPHVNLKPRAKAITHATIPELESITIHSMTREAITSKQKLLNLIMALRAITGEAPGGGGRDSSLGVQIIRARQGAATWKLREGMPIACRVELKGEAMYDFLQSLVDFVLPRMREYPGVGIPPVSGSHLKAHMIGPVVAFGLPPLAMGLFPQIEANIDSYPRLHGFDMYFKTNMKGEHAQMWGRNLLSGFRVPFYRK